MHVHRAISSEPQHDKKAKENDLCAQPGLPHSLSASRNIGSLASYSAHSEDSTQTRQMRRLI